MSIFDFFKKGKNSPVDDSVKQGLTKTRSSILDKIGRLFVGKSKVDDDFLDQLEEVLITSDVGVKTTVKIIERLQKRVEKDKFMDEGELKELLQQEMTSLLTENSHKGQLSRPDQASSSPTHKGPFVIMVVGVNGVGKTTTIGKLAHSFKSDGLKVLLAAGDTFRAGAVDQLHIWSERAGVDIHSHGMNTDPASVAFEAVKKANESDYDVLIVDTAGRLHNKINLMNELSKMKRVMSKIVPDAPHEVLLVLDASTGQNAFEQASKFTEVTEVTALALTKLDGTAKGGVVIGISDTFGIPVRYIGVGEQMNDLKLFNPEAFVNSLFYESKIR
jgi:fused signal recognition particle receptor